MQSLQIVLTREHQSVPWGFRLKGGAEYNVPLSILKVNPGTPAHNKLEFSDQIQSIGNYSAIHLKHEEALNIIRLFEYHLPLVIKREAAVENSNPNSALFWSPSQVPGDQSFQSKPSPFAIEKPGSNFSTSFQHNLTAGPAWPSQTNVNNVYQPAVHEKQIDQHEQKPHPEESYDYKSQYNYHPVFQEQFPIGLHQDGAPPLVVPPPLIRAMTGSALGKKPFTYTPGGLDLSHIRESSRVKRYDQLNKNYEIRPQEQAQQRAFTPSFVDEHGEYQAFITTDSPFAKNKLRPVSTEPQGGVSNEHLVKPNKHRDLINQSTSFRMLNRWIQEAEAHPKQVEPEQRRHTEKLLQESKVLRCIDDSEIRGHPESGVDRTSYVRHNAPLSPYTRLLKLKAQVDSKLGKHVKKANIAQLKNVPAAPAKNNNVDVADKVPAGLRYQEREISKFQGENIPSKTFKYLQYITQEELALEEEEKKRRANQPAQSATQVIIEPSRPAQPEQVEEPAVVEAAPEPVVEAAPEPVVEAAPEPVVEAAPEPAVEAASEPVVEAAPEPVVEAAPEPVVEAASEPVVEVTPEAVAEAPVDETPAAEPVVEAATEPVVEAVAEAPVAEAPAAESVVEAAPEVSAEPVAETTAAEATATESTQETNPAPEAPVASVAETPAQSADTSEF